MNIILNKINILINNQINSNFIPSFNNNLFFNLNNNLNHFMIPQNYNFVINPLNETFNFQATSYENCNCNFVLKMI